MNKVIMGALVASALTLSACSTKSHMSKFSPEQMEKNMKAASEVRPEHNVLKKLAGTWKVDAKFWMDPQSEPEVTKGTATAKLLYGGRYLAQNYKGSFMGQPFEGQGTMGFDNVNKKYFSTWIDSMSTMHMKSEGPAVSQNPNTIVLSSAMTCPLTNEHVEGEEVITIIDNNHYRFEAFQNRGEERFKGMEINYTRIN